MGQYRAKISLEPAWVSIVLRFPYRACIGQPYRAKISLEPAWVSTVLRFPFRACMGQ